MQIKYPDNSLFKNKDGSQYCLVALYSLWKIRVKNEEKNVAEEENIFVTTEIKPVHKTLSNYKCVHLL